MELKLAPPKELPQPVQPLHDPRLGSLGEPERRHATFLLSPRSQDGLSGYRPDKRLIVALLVALGLWASQALYAPLLLGSAEDRVLVRASEVVDAWGGPDPHPNGETLEGDVRVDGRASLACFYDPEVEDGLKIECSIQRFSTRPEADAFHALAEVRLLVDWGLDRRGRVGLVEQMAAFHAGDYGLTEEDDLLAYRVEFDGDSIGQALVARIGNDTYDLAIHGPVAESAQDFAELVGPKLLALRSWEPQR